MSQWFTRRVAVLSIAACALALYSNTFANGFHYDDREVIVENLLVRHIDPVHAFSSSSFDHAGRFPVFRPLLLLSYAVNYRLGGLNPFGYHLANVLLHLLAGWFLYVLMSSTLRSDGGQNASSPLFPWLAAMLFIAHPVNTETVNYIWARSTSLATVWYLLAIVCFLQARAGWQQSVSSRDTAGRPHLWMGCALVAFLFALCSKEIAITLPAALAMADVCYGPRARLRERVMAHLPFWVLAAAYALFMYHHLAGALAEPPPRSISVNLLTQANVIVRYIRLLLLPVGLNVFHVVSEARSIKMFPTPYSVLLILVLLAVVAAAYTRRRLISFAILWFFLTLLPTSSVLPLKILMNEHRLYLPGMGFCMLLAAFLCGPVRRRFPRVALVVVAAILALYVVGTVQRNTVWKNEVTLWADALRKSPGRVEPHIQMGIGYAEQGMLDAAIAEYEEALQIYPYLPGVYYNLGNVYLRKGMYDQAADEYSRALQLDPSSSRANYALGMAYGAQLEFALALEHFTQAKRLDPAHTQATRKIELMHTLQQLHAQATEDLAQDARAARGNFLLGNVYANVGRFRDAAECYERSLEADTSQYAVELALGRIYLNELHDEQKAAAHLRRAAVLSPDAEQRARLLSIVSSLAESR